MMLRYYSSQSAQMNRRLKIGFVALSAVVALSLSGCASQTPGADGTASASAGSDAATVAAEALAVQAEPVSTPEGLGGPIDAASLAGKNVFYIPIAGKAGYFQLIQRNVTDALSRVGVNVETCDGQANPSGISACVDQAISRNADAIIADFIPYELAATAFEQVRQAGIPFYMAGEVLPEGITADAMFAGSDPDGYNVAVTTGAANAVIADSDGQAHVLYLHIVQSPSTERAGTAALEHFASACPDCEVTVKEINLSQLKDVPSLVSSALVSDPSITYVIPQYDSYVPPAIQGIQAAGKVNAVKVATSGATLGVLQQVDSNPQLIAVTGQNAPYIAWTMADAVLRMLTGEKPQDEYPPLTRAFTKENVGDLELTPEAEFDGSWYGDVATYQDAFLELWGAE
jgi:ribose transport system substrate-binding protein